MIEVKRRKSESSESMLRRFSRRVRQSGVLVRTKKGRFRQEDPSRNQRQADTLGRLRRSAEIAYLKKIGKFDEEAYAPRGRRRKKPRPADQTIPSSKPAA